MTGVPSQAKGQAILDAATAAFLRHGYAASVDDIAAVAGVGKQTVYRHFGDKQALFLAAVAAARAATTAPPGVARAAVTTPPGAGHATTTPPDAATASSAVGPSPAALSADAAITSDAAA